MTEPHDDEAPEWLQGRWRLQEAEAGLDLQAHTRMQFGPEGMLVYIIQVEGSDLHFELGYRVRGEVLYTDFGDDHQAAPRFRRTEDGLLELDFGGRRAWFRYEHLM